MESNTRSERTLSVHDEADRKAVADFLREEACRDVREPWNAQELPRILRVAADYVVDEPRPTPPASDAEPKRHRWSPDGETCVDCGNKDWMGGPCSENSADDSGEACRWCDGRGQHLRPEALPAGHEHSGTWVHCRQCGGSGKPPENSGEALLWDKARGGYVSAGAPGFVTDYRKAHRYSSKEAPQGWADANPHRFALADSEGWVRSWGSQPVKAGVWLEVQFRNGEQDIIEQPEVADWTLHGTWHDMTFFRLPVTESSTEGERHAGQDLSSADDGRRAASERAQARAGEEDIQRIPNPEGIDGCVGETRPAAQDALAEPDGAALRPFPGGPPICACGEVWNEHHPECPAVVAWDARAREIVRDEIAQLWRR